MRRLLFPFPSLREQQAIASFLDMETAKLDALVTKVREAIDRLRELRVALISAAVTGRIDVREGGGMNRIGVQPGLLRWACERSGRRAGYLHHRSQSWKRGNGAQLCPRSSSWRFR